MGLVKQQFFPNSDRTELLVEVQLPRGSSIEGTTKSVAEVEAWLKQQKEVATIDSYIGAGAPRFFLSLNPESPDPSFAKLVVQTASPDARDALRGRLETAVNDGLAPAARVRLSTLLLGPPVPYPVVFRVHGPDLNTLRDQAEAVRAAIADHPMLRDVHLEYGERVPELRVVFDPARLAAIGLTAEEASRQLGAAVSGQAVTQVRDGNRLVEVVLRASEDDRSSAQKLENAVLVTTSGQRIPLMNVGKLVVSSGEPIMKRWSRTPYIAIRADVAPGVQPPDATAAVLPVLDPIKAKLPEGYEIQTGGAVEEAGKANGAIAATAPITLGFMLLFIMLQVRSFRLMALTFATAPLGMIGAVLALLIFRQPFGFVAILGLIGLAGILMRNTLILVDQIKAETAAGASDYDAIIESTVRRARPVILTALAAVLAFIPLTLSTFWGPLAFVLIGGVTVGTAEQLERPGQGTNPFVRPRNSHAEQRLGPDVAAGECISIGREVVDRPGELREGHEDGAFRCGGRLPEQRRKRPGLGLQDRDRPVSTVQEGTTCAVDQRPSSKRWHGRPKACGEHRYGVGEES